MDAVTSMPDGFVGWYRGLEKRKLLSERYAKEYPRNSLSPRTGSSDFALRVLPLAAIGALFAIAAWVRLGALQESPYPTGIDGYWYLIQVRSLIERGHLDSSSAPLVPWLMAAASLLLEPVLAVKTIAALGSAAMVVPSYSLARRLSGERGPALLGAALVATSAQSFFLCTEFVKQAVGLTLAVAFAAALAARLERPSKARIALAALMLLACALAHKTALGLALLVAAPPAAAHIWRRRGRVVLGLAVAALAAIVVAWLMHNERSPLRGLFHGGADFSFAVLATPGHAPLVLGHEVSLAAGLAALVLVLAVLRRDGPRLPILAVGFIGIALFQALPWLDIANDQGLGYRLRLCAWFCLAPCSAIAADGLLQWVPEKMRTTLLGLAICGVLALRPWHSDEGVIKAHPAMVEATARLAGVLPPEAVVVVPERHTAYMAAWYGRVNVRLRPPPVMDLDASRMFRLLPGAAIRPGLWAALDELRLHPAAGVVPSLDLHAMHPNGLVLLAEPTYQFLVARLPDSERQWYRAWVVQ